MSDDIKDNEQDHNEAFVAFMRAVADPTQRESAKRNPIVGNILSKLSPSDLDTLAKVADNQTLTNHGPLLQKLNTT